MYVYNITKYRRTLSKTNIYAQHINIHSSVKACTHFTAMAVAAHIAAAAKAFADQAVTGKYGDIGIDAEGTVHKDLHGADVITFKSILDPALCALDHRNLDRNFTAAWIKRDKMKCESTGKTVYVCVLDCISTISTCAELEACSDRRLMFPRIMCELLDQLPPEFTAVRTGVITSAELAAKLVAGRRFKLVDSVLYCYRDTDV